MSEIDQNLTTEAAENNMRETMNSRKAAAFQDHMFEFEDILEAIEGFSHMLVDVAGATRPSPKTLSYLAVIFEGHAAAARTWFDSALLAARE
jgi:hypothetical protein